MDTTAQNRYEYQQAAKLEWSNRKVDTYWNRIHMYNFDLEDTFRISN